MGWTSFGKAAEVRSAQVEATVLFAHPTLFRREPSASIKYFVRRSVGPSVGPLITLNVIFSVVCGRIDLKFGGDLHGFMAIIVFSSYSSFFLAAPLNSSSSFSSEIESFPPSKHFYD
jgi:hypothetical protein